MNLRDLLAVFILEEANFNILHWNCKGKKFDRMHALAQDWYERCNTAKDAVAEMAMRNALNPVHYGEAISILKNSEINFKILSSDDIFEYDEFMEEAQEICKNICTAIAEVLYSDEIQNDKVNVGIKATLEAMYEEWDLDMRYKNTHRV